MRRVVGRFAAYAAVQLRMNADQRLCGGVEVEGGLNRVAVRDDGGRALLFFVLYNLTVAGTPQIKSALYDSTYQKTGGSCKTREGEGEERRRSRIKAPRPWMGAAFLSWLP